MEYPGEQAVKSLDKLAPTIDGSVSHGSYEFPPGGSLSLKAEFPGLKGTYGARAIWITFSITSDASQVRAGQSFGEPTIAAVDYLNPYLQVHVYQSCPFTLRLTPERTDVMTKITRLLRLESKGLQTGGSYFDGRYFLDCRSGRERAESFLRQSDPTFVRRSQAKDNSGIHGPATSGAFTGCGETRSGTYTTLRIQRVDSRTW